MPRGCACTHAAGSVDNATRSRTQRRRLAASLSAAANAGAAGAVACAASLLELNCGSTALPQLPDELVGRRVERVLLQDAADDHHGMRAHDVHHHRGVELR